jgi:hypothetical protein
MSVAAGKNLRETRASWTLCMDGPLRIVWVYQSLLSPTDVNGECYGQ